MSSIPARTVAAYFAAIRAMDREAWVACFAENGATHDPVGAPPHVGHAALQTFFDGIVGMTKTIGLHEDYVQVCGSRAAVKWTGRGVGRNERSFEFEGIDIIEVGEDGKIVKIEAYWDPADLVRQLSVT